MEHARRAGPDPREIVATAPTATACTSRSRTPRHALAWSWLEDAGSNRRPSGISARTARRRPTAMCRDDATPALRRPSADQRPEELPGHTLGACGRWVLAQRLHDERGCSPPLNLDASTPPRRPRLHPRPRPRPGVRARDVQQLRLRGINTSLSSGGGLARIVREHGSRNAALTRPQAVQELFARRFRGSPSTRTCEEV